MKKTTAAFALSHLAGVALAGAALAQAPGESTAWRAVECDHACLSQFARDYVAALAKRNAASLKQLKTVRFTENDVELPFGKAQSLFYVGQRRRLFGDIGRLYQSWYCVSGYAHN